jgi:hypothetical protein
MKVPGPTSVDRVLTHALKTACDGLAGTVGARDA